MMHTAIADALRESLTNSSQWLRMVFQPQYALDDSRRLVGTEALIRWRHPRLGEISPADFIPVAEMTNQIVDLDRFVYRRIIGLIQAWQAFALNFPPISVNISPLSLCIPGFIDELIQSVEDADIPQRILGIEITERERLETNSGSLKKMELIKQAGIGISIDDFGVGYSSFPYIKHKIASELKIDRSFVSGIGHTYVDEAIIRSMIILGHSLGLKIVAEGIETKDQLDWLKTSGCQIGQGYFLSVPLEFEDYTRLISHQALVPH
ncbi:EAL domain-containing protein [Azospirillum sp. A29]|uniref:EAL domain-containing protein n=1 Tax=unclassified Azospirillum TaxID=2630922 RepID=UPI003670D485